MQQDSTGFGTQVGSGGSAQQDILAVAGHAGVGVSGTVHCGMQSMAYWGTHSVASRCNAKHGRPPHGRACEITQKIAIARESMFVLYNGVRDGTRS